MMPDETTEQETMTGFWAVRFGAALGLLCVFMSQGSFVNMRPQAGKREGLGV